MGGLKALIQKRIYLFNTSYPDVSKRILLNWLQHYERCRNGSLQKIYSLFHYYDNLCTPFLGWDLEFCCFYHRDTGFHVCHELQIICHLYCKKEEIKAFSPLPAQLQEAVLVQNLPFCLPLQPSAPSMQGEAHLSCLVLATVLQSPSGFSDRRQKEVVKKDEEAKNWLQVFVVWYSFWDNKKANFLTLQTQFLSLKCYYIYLWMCFICAHFVRMAGELCRVQENSSLIKLI